MSVLMSILLPHVFNQNDEMVHCHEVSSSSSGRKLKLLSYLSLYILER